MHGVLLWLSTKSVTLKIGVPLTWQVHLQSNGQRLRSRVQFAPIIWYPTEFRQSAGKLEMSILWNSPTNCLKMLQRLQLTSWDMWREKKRCYRFKVDSPSESRSGVCFSTTNNAHHSSSSGSTQKLQRQCRMTLQQLRVCPPVKGHPLHIITLSWLPVCSARTMPFLWT